MFKNTPTIHCLAISTVVVTHGKIQTSGSQPSLHIRIPQRARTGPDAPVHWLGVVGGGHKVEIHLVTPKSVQGLPLEGRAANREGRERTHQSRAMFYSLSEGGCRGVCYSTHNFKTLNVFQTFTKGRRPSDLREISGYCNFSTYYPDFPTGFLGNMLIRR